MGYFASLKLYCAKKGIDFHAYVKPEASKAQPKRPCDANQLAKFIVTLSTGDVEEKNRNEGKRSLLQFSVESWEV